jgi:hypothetical protein
MVRKQRDAPVVMHCNHIGIIVANSGSVSKGSQSQCRGREEEQSSFQAIGSMKRKEVSLHISIFDTTFESLR